MRVHDRNLRVSFSQIQRLEVPRRKNFMKNATAQKNRSDYSSVRGGRDLGGHDLKQSQEEETNHEDPA